MKPHFAAETRTRVAGWAMEQARAFSALIAPWLALPGDRAMSWPMLVIVLLVFAIGLAAVGYGGTLAIRELLPVPRSEVQP